MSEPKTITISTGDVVMEAELNNGATAGKIWDSLPISAKANTWGEEIYFSIPVKHGEENPKEVVEEGELGYWPPGTAFCIFFGPTPASRGMEIRPASPVNPIGKVLGDAKNFKSVNDGETVKLEKKQ